MFNEWNSTDEKTIFIDGTEAKIVIEFCRLRNCKLLIKPCRYIKYFDTQYVSNNNNLQYFAIYRF